MIFLLQLNIVRSTIESIRFVYTNSVIAAKQIRIAECWRLVRPGFYRVYHNALVFELPRDFQGTKKHLLRTITNYQEFRTVEGFNFIGSRLFVFFQSSVIR